MKIIEATDDNLIKVPDIRDYEDHTKFALLVQFKGDRGRTRFLALYDKHVCEDKVVLLYVKSEYGHTGEVGKQGRDGFFKTYELIPKGIKFEITQE